MSLKISRLNFIIALWLATINARLVDASACIEAGLRY